MVKRYLTPLLLLLVMVEGCASNKRFQIPVSEEPRYVHFIDDIISDMVDEVCLKLAADGKKKRVVLLECFCEECPVTDLDGHVSLVGRSQFGRCFSKKNSKLKLFKEDLIRDNMAQMDLSAIPEDIKNKASKWKKLGAGVVISSRWRSRQDDSLEFIYEVIDTKAGGELLFSVVRTVAQDDSLRKLMGQKLPGSLAVECKSSEAEVYVDGEFKGVIESGGIVLEVPFGPHSLRIDKKGYTSFAKHIEMSERGVEHIKVKFSQSSSAPVKGMLLNALLPGSANLKYSKKVGIKNNAVVASGFFALSFYTTGIMWAIDNFKSNDFLTKKDQDRHNTIKNIELYATLGSYIGNVAAGWLVGNAYRKVSKRGVEYTEARVENNIMFYVATDAKQTRMFKIRVMFK